MQLQSQPNPLIQTVGRVGAAEARAIRLVKNSLLYNQLVRAGKSFSGKLGNATGDAFRKWAKKYLFPGAKDLGSLASDKESPVADFEWRNSWIEIKSGRTVDKQIEKTEALATKAGVNYVVVFLEKPTPAATKIIKEKTGRDPYYVFESFQ